MHLIMHLIEYGDSIIVPPLFYLSASVDSGSSIVRFFGALEHSKAAFCSDMNQGDLECDEINGENQAVRRDP